MISFLIPFRDADMTRTEPMRWVLASWQKRYPDAEFILAPDDGTDPFNKSMAVNAAFAASRGDVLVILDADTIIDPVAFSAGLEMIRDGTAPWVIPANVAWRLNMAYTRTLLDGTPDAGRALAAPRSAVEQASTVVGFCHVLPRAAYMAVGGMDERFRGWGGEDSTFAMAVDTMYGPHAKLSSTLVSLWHSRPRNAGGQRVWLGQYSRAANTTFFRSYSAARGNPVAMREVLSEIGAPMGRATWYRRQTIAREVSMHVFTCHTMPALMFRAGEKKLKFVGGRLAVSDEDLEAVRDFVARRPEYVIQEERAPIAAVVTDPGENPHIDPAFVAELEAAAAADAPAAEDTAPVDPATNDEPVAEQPDPAPLDNDPDDLTNKQLDELLKAKELSTRGNHAEKVARLREA